MQGLGAGAGAGPPSGQVPFSGSATSKMSEKVVFSIRACSQAGMEGLTTSHHLGTARGYTSLACSCPCSLHDFTSSSPPPRPG